MSVHYIEVCEKHGRILGQCRCADRNKVVRKVPCLGWALCRKRPKYVQKKVEDA